MASAPATRGPDALLLRVPTTGGAARVTAYPSIDSTVWTGTGQAPELDRVLAFDQDAGTIAAADKRGRPLWIDLNTGTITQPSRSALRDLSSADGSTIYGIGADGAVARFTPSGNWVFKPAEAARNVFPASDGTLLVLEGRAAQARLLRVHPPATKVLDSLVVAGASGGLGAQLGDRVFLLADGPSIIAVRSRTLDAGDRIKLPHPVVTIAATPSGDRCYVLEQGSQALNVVDPVQAKITATITLPGKGRDLRVDPFGRYVLVRAPGDSAWVVSIGADRVVQTIHSAWRSDLPFVAPDGAIATLSESDVVFIDVGTQRELHRAVDGASDFWYAFVWNGLHPRAAALDTPVQFGHDTDTVAAAPPVAKPVDTTHRAPPPVDSTKLGFTVSFAALLNEASARDQASKIVVNGQTARVVTGITEGTAIYRVVLGPFSTREEAERVGRASGHSYVVYAGTP